MGFLDAFVDRGDKPQRQDPKKVVPPKVTPTNVAITQISPVVPVSTMNSPEFEAFRQQFAKILDDENKRNYPGNDYYEFVVMLRAMIGVPDDVRYKAVFAGWAVGGNQTKESLISTAKIYLGLVEKEIKDFETAYNQQYSLQVTKNEELIQKKTLQVQQLSEQVRTLSEEITNLKQENLEKTAGLKTKHDAFMAAGEVQRQEILNEIDNINHFIN